ncbi:MAG: ABC transporter ATP-binding protein, partial [Nocardioidaceae bacterium]
GIRWMRDLLRDYADRGGTVLLSSHLLNELEAIADDLVVIGQGRIVAQGAKSELLQATGTVARTPRTEDLARALSASGLTARPTADGALHIDADPELVGQVALHAGLVLTELRPAESNGLEEIFLELTADTQREGAAA